jgi:hypothetical protein
MSLGTQGPRTHGLPPAARGAALIGLLVVIGIVGLQVLDDSSPSRGDVTVTTLPGQTTLPGAATTLAPGTTARPATTKAATVTTKAAATATTKATTVTTVAAAKLKKVADTKVIVYNASGVNGVASNMSNKLKSVGYNVTDTGNLDPVRTGTTVACRAGLDAEAARLANDVGGGATASAFPANPPKGSDADDCIVILGKAA